MSQASNLERQMLDLINQERSAQGLQPLRLELNLNDSSEDHSSWILQADVFSHTGAGGSRAGQRMEAAGFDFSGSSGWGENIALQSERGAPGLADDVVDLHNSLMNSPGHRANILNPNYEVIGIGIELGNYKGWEAVVVTQNFAYTSGSLQVDTGSGSGSGSGPGVPQPPAPDSAPPVLRVDTIALDAGRWERVADKVEVHDTEGDTPSKYKIKDKSGLFEFSVNGEVLSPHNKSYIVTAEQFDDLMIRTDEPGVRKQIIFWAKDDDGWGVWEQSQVISTPKGNRPLVSVENMVFGQGQARAENLADHLTVIDRTDDSIKWYELLDKSGRDNFLFRGQGVIDAASPFRVSAAEIDEIFVRGDAAEMKSFAKVRAFDGEKLSGWEVFAINTVAEDDPLLIV